MKLFFVLFISCLVGVNCSFMSKEPEVELEDNEKQAVRECAQELGVDESKYMHGVDIDEYAEDPNEEKTCMLACGFRKILPQIDEDLKGLGDKETLYEGFLKMINFAYEENQSEFEALSPRENVTSKVENCYSTANSDCGFFGCVEVYKPPFADAAVQYVLKKLAESVKDSESD